MDMGPEESLREETGCRASWRGSAGGQGVAFPHGRGAGRQCRPLTWRTRGRGLAELKGSTDTQSSRGKHPQSDVRKETDLSNARLLSVMKPGGKKTANQSCWLWGRWVMLPPLMILCSESAHPAVWVPLHRVPPQTSPRSLPPQGLLRKSQCRCHEA